ncbi:helix-turn-helix domain-containing protein [Clostridium hydrogenum]|uniref:helix-turn-helix domain-containing protein n=1 Tax=Clostridium hydrogenum TaxID=2855764 RepID=UPI001F15974E|nr:AraC family transcriptional regulator [Clostridium hydrogenum]
MINHSKLTNNTYKENVSHIIENRPYSIHQTHVAANNNLVLYQHWHDEIEIFYLEQGEIEFAIEDTQFCIHEGEALLIPPNLLHMATKTNNETCSFFALVFSQVLFTEAFTNATYARFVQPLKHNGLIYLFKFSPNISWQNKALLLLKKILCFYGRQDIDTWELELHGLLYQLWNLYYLNHMTSVSLSSNYVKLYGKLKPSIEYIHENFSFDMTISLLSKQSGLCTGTFCRYFKELTGLTTFNYLNRFRIRKSCEALLNTSLNITEIANMSGFNNISYFNRSFLKHVKCKPSEYRKQNMKL